MFGEQAKSTYSLSAVLSCRRDRVGVPELGRGWPQPDAVVDAVKEDLEATGAPSLLCVARLMTISPFGFIVT
jgi:hypothetical protein